VSLPLLNNEFCREVEEFEDAKMKSEDRSLKTFLSNDDADESIANHHTDVRFHYIQLKSFQFPSILFVYFVTELKNCLTFAQFKLKYMKISENIKYV
jgi:hypothetical protein